MRKWLLVVGGILLSAFLFAQQVSERKEIAVMPVYSSFNLPSAAFMFFDDRMIATLAAMRRFQVIGYQFRLDGTTAERFIQRIRELKKESTLRDPQFRDENLGIAVIPASKMERLVNSVFIFVPSINGYDSRSYDIEIRQRRQDGGYQISIVREHKATVNVSIKIIDAEGNLLTTYDRSGEGISRESAGAAYQEAVNAAVGGLGHYLRTVEAFQIRTGVLRVDGNFVYLELGKDMGILPGYEFAIQEEVKIMDRFTERRQTGLVRVSFVSDEYSYGHVIFGQPKQGDQLVEAPKTGLRLGISAGVMPWVVPARATLVYTGGVSFTNTLSFSSIGGYAPALFLTTALEAGYSWLWETGFGIGIASPFVLSFNTGVAHEWFMRNMSLVLGGRFAMGIGMANVGTIDVPHSVTIEGRTFRRDVDVSLTWFDFGLQPHLSYNIQFNQSTKLRLFGGFHWSFYQMNSLSFRERVHGEEEAVSASTTPTFRDWDGRIGATGVFGGIEVIFRL